MAFGGGWSSLGKDSGLSMRNVVEWACFSVSGGRELPTWGVGRDDQSLGLPILISTHWTGIEGQWAVTRENTASTQQPHLSPSAEWTWLGYTQ